MCCSSSRVFPLKRRAANKPDSVHLLSETPIIHLSDQPGVLWHHLQDANRTGSAFSSLFDLAPERVCLVTRRFSRAGGLLPRLFTVAEAFRPLRCLFLWHFPLRRFARRPRPVEAGFPPCGVRTFLCLAAATGHSRVASGEIFKDRSRCVRRGRGCGHTSCTPQSTAACPARRSSRSRRQADRRTAAARDGTHRTRSRG